MSDWTKSDYRLLNRVTAIDPHGGLCLLTRVVNPHIECRSMVEVAHLLPHTTPELDVRILLRLYPRRRSSIDAHVLLIVYR
jgi:hypothetical protein